MTSQKIPEEWQDAKRAAFLMKEFRPREANPEGYDDKMSFWVRNILRWSSQDNVVMTPASVREAFVREGIPPDNSCIKHVLNHMMREGKLVKKSLFQQELKTRQSSRSSWVSWGVSLATKPLSWGVSYLTATPELQDGQEGSWIPDDEELVNPEQVKIIADSIFNQLNNKSKKVFNWLEVQQSSPSTSSEVLSLALQYLNADSRAVTLEDCDQKLVKIASSSFTKTEIGLARLESARQVIQSEVKQIGSQMESLKEEARSALKDKNMTVAKQLLKRKKRLENLQSNKESQLDNIDLLIRQLADSDSQDAILRSYQEAAQVLKSVQTSTPVLESDKIICNLEDALHSYNELSHDMSRVLDPNGDLDHGDLEQELNDILNEETTSELKMQPTVRTQGRSEEKDVSIQSETSTKEGNNRKTTQEEDFDQLLGRLEKLRRPTHSPDDSSIENTESQQHRNKIPLFSHK